MDDDGRKVAESHEETGEEITKTQDAEDTSVSEEVVLDEVLENVPPKHRKMIEKFMISSFQMQAEVSPEHEVMKKITPDHISEYLSASKEGMEKDFKDRNNQRIFIGVMSILIMAFVLGIVLILKNTPDVMEKVLYAGGGLLAGAFGGYGYGKNKGNE